MSDAAGPEALDGSDGGPRRDAVSQAQRDPEALAVGLARWLAGHLGEGADPEVSGIDRYSANGMSSETVLFDASWHDGAGRRAERLVARLAPDDDGVPVFPTYALGHQVELMRIVAERTSVPVPDVRWYEPGAGALGTPFFVMERVDGDVPPDVLPYNFGDSWLSSATVAEQRALQDATVAVLAELHGIEPAEELLAFLQPDAAGGTALRRHVGHTRAWYEWSARRDGLRSPLVEQGFEWLERHWPDDDDAPAVLSWGDARIGNVIYRDMRPVAVLDWEMAGLGPRELDVAWLLMAHRVFEDLAGQWDLPGMPDLLRVDDVAATYEALTGHAPRHLDFYGTYAAIQWGIVFLRTGWRQVHLGLQAPPPEVDDLLHHRATLERALAGRCWG